LSASTEKLIKLKVEKNTGKITLIDALFHTTKGLKLSWRLVQHAASQRGGRLREQSVNTSSPFGSSQRNEDATNSTCIHLTYSINPSKKQQERLKEKAVRSQGRKKGGILPRRAGLRGMWNSPSNTIEFEKEVKVNNSPE
jgi:hypothetical protein